MQKNQRMSESDTIEGTATISIAQLDAFRKQSETIRKMERDREDTKELLSQLVSHLDDEAYLKRCAEIDEIKNISDRKLRKLGDEAAQLIEIHVDAEILKKIIRKYIDVKKSDAHFEIAQMKNDELEGIKIHLDTENKQEEMEE